MGVSLEKVQEGAPHLVSLYKDTGDMLRKKGINPDRYPAAVVMTLDFSGSAEPLYRSGQMQNVADLGFAAGLVFDDDGSVPISIFHDRAIDLGEMSLSNCNGFVAKATKNQHMGMTDYVSALRWIVNAAGYGNVDLGSPGNLSIRSSAPYPVYALFVTDGEPNRGTEDAIRAYLTLMSQLPIFVQFVGVGNHNFAFLKTLDELDGRLIDNAGFFDSKDVGNDQQRMLDAMLSEFPLYYGEAKRMKMVG